MIRQWEYFVIHDPVFDLSGALPFLRFHFFPGSEFELPTYFIVISLASCMGLLWFVRRAERAGLERNRALDIALLVMTSGFLGARLYHILLEEPRYYAEDLWRTFEFWRGGFVWFGGALAALAAGLAYLRHKRAPFGVWLDLAAPVAAFVYALGRIACLLTGCCYGSICTLANGHRFRYPTQVFALAWELAVVGALLWLERKRTMAGQGPWLRRDGQIFLIWLALHAIGRIVMELMRGDPRGPDFWGLSQATWISLGILGCLVYFASHSMSKFRR